MSIQPRTSRRSAPVWLRPALALRRRAGRVIAFLLRTPALLAGVFVAAAALYFSMLLTVDRAPADALPTTPASTNCAMFCTATEAPKHVDTAAAADETPTCWLFCEPARRLGL
ncbi:hypothetical protein IU459_32675 [Nocardia amamiensis]|uniref:Uncharacterized protein n=1 Tax=Nocardia amamiensis TaxID=404578 RepID=A0ABS0D088_9NOCA|nr:hypothetical protein [Nocardia amamiensis]MBF6302260.1 hypothetical protein [Nocardia amamiensis]